MCIEIRVVLTNMRWLHVISSGPGARLVLQHRHACDLFRTRCPFRAPVPPCMWSLPDMGPVSCSSTAMHVISSGPGVRLVLQHRHACDLLRTRCPSRAPVPACMWSLPDLVSVSCFSTAMHVISWGPGVRLVLQHRHACDLFIIKWEQRF